MSVYDFPAYVYVAVYVLTPAVVHVAGVVTSFVVSTVAVVVCVASFAHVIVTVADDLSSVQLNVALYLCPSASVSTSDEYGYVTSSYS